MPHSIESITKVTETIRKNLDFSNRRQLGDMQTITLAHHTESDREKILVLQLTDYIQHLLNLSAINGVIKDEQRLQTFLKNITLMETSTQLIAKSFDEMRIQNDEVLKRAQEVEIENRKLKENVSKALKVWSRNDENFEDPRMVEIADVLTGKTL